MRAWRRASYDVACGAEMGCLIRAGDAYLEMSGEGWRKVRCAAHADEPCPKVIVPERAPITPPLTAPKRDDESELEPVAPMTSARDLSRHVRLGPKMLKFDHKKAQSGDAD